MKKIIFASMIFFLAGAFVFSEAITNQSLKKAVERFMKDGDYVKVTGSQDGETATVYIRDDSIQMIGFEERSGTPRLSITLDGGETLRLGSGGDLTVTDVSNDGSGNLILK